MKTEMAPFSMALVLFLSSFLLVFPAFRAKAQINPGAPALFGIDGDIKNDYRLSGSFSAAGSHDWFKLSGGIGMGIIDVSNTSAYSASLAAGNNLAFNLGMAVPRYSVVDGKLLLDARYSRDQFGNGSSSGTLDRTSFSGGKNGENPGSWTTNPLGGIVGDKNDIIDAYMHLRRDGTILSSSGPSHLIANVGISTVGTTGARYFDAELYCSNLDYNTTTGLFSNSGPALTGGHTAWSFNADGTVKNFGDVTISFAFMSGTCSEIYLMIWVAQTDLASTPANFDFVPGEYFGSVSGYGYARIKPKSGSAAEWGGANTAITNTTPWGTNSKTLGTNSLNGYATSYDVGQLGEAAIDLTLLGIDPALIPGNDACNPPFNRILFKSRASNSFTAALHDFAGPYTFLDGAPDKQIVSPAVLTCANSSVSLQPVNPDAGSYYRWSTANGAINGNAVNAFITVSQPGKYYLYSSALAGCYEQVDSVIVGSDLQKPAAAITASGFLNKSFPSMDTVVLTAGNEAASNYSNAYGSYQGLLWSWTNNKGKTGNSQQFIANDSGRYTLVVTQLSNGCKDTAHYNLMMVASSPLYVNLSSFSAQLVNEKQVALNWVSETEVNAGHYEIERSEDGRNFKVLGVVMAAGNSNSVLRYQFKDALTADDRKLLYYRLKMVDLDRKIEYSSIALVNNRDNKMNPVQVHSYPNPVTDALYINIPKTWQGKKIALSVLSVSGQVSLYAEKSTASQTEMLATGVLTAGVYFLKIDCGGEIAFRKIVRK